MPYTRQQLFFNDYHWDSAYLADHPIEHELPDYTPLNRMDGYEVLCFINRCAHLWNWKEKFSSYRNLERVIRDGVPRFVHTHGEMRAFIEKYYTTL